MLEIKKDSDPILRQRCQPVEKFDEELRFLIKEMLETMYKNNGIGLAGPQVGELKKLFVFDAGKGAVVMINPEIVESSEDQSAMLEGCLSLPGVEISVKRPKKITIKYQDEYGNDKELKASGMTAKVIQHEYDHLWGKLISDYQGLWERLKNKSKNILKHE